MPSTHAREGVSDGGLDLGQNPKYNSQTLARLSASAKF